MGSKEKTLNPWVSIWTKPRATIQQIVDTNPEYLVSRLAAIDGFSLALGKADSMKSVGPEWEWPAVFLFAAIVGPIVGIIRLYIGSDLLRWTGTWIGGSASSQNIRAALAWSNVPTIWSLILWIPLFALSVTETPTIDATPSLEFFSLGLVAIVLSIGIWSYVVLLKCLGQVQSFSAWKALVNVILAWLVPIGLILGLFLVFGLISFVLR